MGLTKAQILEKSRKKLYDYLNEHSTGVRGSKIAKKIWNKYPICAKDICVNSVILTKDNEILFTDYDKKEDSYPKEFCRKYSDLEKEYLDLIYQQISDYDSKHT